MVITSHDGFDPPSWGCERRPSVFHVLAELGEIDQDVLAASFAQHYDFQRGYGPGTGRLLHEILDGVPWQHAVASTFDGRGSYGNGAAMRVAPLGAYFGSDLDSAADQATRSAAVTHAHPGAIAGAIAVSGTRCMQARQRCEVVSSP